MRSDGSRRRRGPAILVGSIACAVSVLLASCTVLPSAAAMVAAICGTGTSSFTNVGQITDPALKEISGVVASRAHNGVLWVHNDSGAPPQFFAVSTAGTVLGTFNVTGASASDWEDVAIGPGPQAGVTYLYFGDIGDNAVARSSIAVYRVPEPVVAVGAPVGTQSVAGEKLTLTYPDGAHNAETLLADTNGDLYILTKVLGSGTLYKAPANLAAGSSTVLTKTITVNNGSQLFTGGDIAPAGDAVVVRTYGELFAWNRGAGTTIADALSAPPCQHAAHYEPQGEAIGFQPDAHGMVSISEGVSPSIGNYRAP